MLVFSALVAGSFSLGGRIANEIDPIALTAVRFAIAGSIVAGIALALGQFNKSVLQSSWRYVVLGGLFSTYFVLMFEGLKTAHPVSAAAVFTLTPPMAALFGWWIMRQHTTLRILTALTMGAAGALWVIFQGRIEDLLAFRVGKGEMIYFVGCIAHALYIPLVPKLNRGEAVLPFACGTMVTGAILLGILGFSRIAATDWAALEPRVWWTLVYISIFASVASISLLQFASMKLKAAKVMAYTYLTPSWVLLWEIGLTGDLPPPVFIFGIVLTLVALAMLLASETPYASVDQRNAGN